MVPLVVLLTACGSPIQDVESRVLNDLPTLVEVTWTTRDEVSSHVVYGTGDALDLATPPDAASTEHTAILRGLAPSTEASFQIVAGDDEGEVLSVETGALDEVFPDFTLEGTEQEHFTVVPVYGTTEAIGVVILDGLGRTVWQVEDERGLYVTRARLTHDGSGVVYNSSDLNGHEDETQELVWVSWRGEEIRTEQVPLMAHDFVQKSDGTIVTMAFEDRDGVLGTKLIEVAPDGTQTEPWSAWDCFDPAVHTHGEMAMGWNFANALDYDEQADLYLMSMRNFGSIVAIDGSTWECPWVFGDVAGTVDITGSTFKHQHQFQLLDDALLVFDNDGRAGASRVIEYDFDPTAGTASESWSYLFDSWNVVLGDVHRLDDGDTVAVWAVHAQIDRITPGGEVTASMTTAPGTVLGFISMEDDLYPE